MAPSNFIDRIKSYHNISGAWNFSGRFAGIALKITGNLIKKLNVKESFYETSDRLTTKGHSKKEQVNQVAGINPNFVYALIQRGALR